MSAQQLRIEKLVYGGDGLARSAEGVVLVPFTAPGETIDAEVGMVEKGVRRGRPVRIVEPSSDRVPAPCPYFIRCGGCHYQHLQYSAQTAAKASILEETLMRVSKIALTAPVRVISGEPWQYRNRIQLHFEQARMGFRAMRSRDLVEIDHCPISSPRLNECIIRLAAMAKNPRWPRFLGTIELFTNEDAVQLNVLQTGQPVARRFFEWCEQEIAGFVMGPLHYAGFRVSKGSFFQVNRFLIDQLVGEVTADARGVTALDLYAGVGLFSLPLAVNFDRVIAVESGTGAIRDLEFNAASRGVKVEAKQGNVDQFLETFSGPCDLVVADPPRAGLGKIGVKRLIALAPPRIVVVACDPATLARDLAPLLSAGYVLHSAALIDLFPQTYHIETVAKLIRA